jgi:hypothetical protein
MAAMGIGGWTMRFAGLFAVIVVLGGCDVASGPNGTGPTNATKANSAALPAPDGGFDYRYAFRLPASRIEAVQESHARGCDQLGPARCRITAMRYAVGADNAIAAVLTMTLDPTVARAFGKAAAQTVNAAHGTMTDATIAGAEATGGGGRGGAVLARLRDALANAESSARGATDPEQKALASAKADRVRSAITTIGDVDQGSAGGTATVPVLFQYSSNGGIPGVGASPAATFESAGDTFLASLAGLLVVLAGIGPWLLLLLGGALLLRWFLARTEGTAAPVLPPAPQEHGTERTGIVQRWFQPESPDTHDTPKAHEPVA